MAISLNSSGNSGALSTQTSVSFSFNNVAGTFLVIGVAVRDDANNSFAATYNSVSLTSQKSQIISGGSVLEGEVFTLVNPATGSNTVSITWGGASIENIGVVAMSFTGVDLASPVDATAGSGEAPGTINPRSTNITTVTQGAMIVDCCYDRTNPTATASAGQTETMNVQPNGGTDCALASYKLATTPGSYAMGWSVAETTQDWSEAIIALKPATTTISSITYRPPWRS